LFICGRKEEAIKVEEEAVKLLEENSGDAESIRSYKETLEKFKK
jgi:hypothetical protein